VVHKVDRGGAKKGRRGEVKGNGKSRGRTRWSEGAEYITSDVTKGVGVEREKKSKRRAVASRWDSQKISSQTPRIAGKRGIQPSQDVGYTDRG